MRKLYVRADGNAQIGVGHLMRVMAVTDCLRARVWPTFLCAMEQSAEFVKSKGYEAIVLQTDLENMDEELPILAGLLSGGDKKDILLVDSYYVTDTYLEALARICDVFLFDDLGEHVYPAAGIINYHCYADTEWYRSSYPKSHLMLGADYVPLRLDFMKGRGEKLPEDGHVLLTTGGGDRSNIGGQIMERIYRKDLFFHWVLGPFSPNLSFAQDFADGKTNIRLEMNVTDMAGLMRKCGLAVTAGGTTIYEMCAMELPMIVFSYAQNQEKLTGYIGEHGCGYYGGSYDRDPQRCLSAVSECFQKAAREPERRKQFAARAKKLVDGRGAMRLSEALFHELCEDMR